MREVIQKTIVELLRGACEASGSSALVSLDATLGDLAIDSMKLIELIFELERSLGFEADEGQLASLGTVRDLVEMVEAAMVGEVQECTQRASFPHEVPDTRR